MKFKDQNIGKGSSLLADQKHFDKDSFMIENMDSNLAYLSYIENNDINNESEKLKILKNFQNKYRNYRENWKSVEKKISEGNFDDLILKPQCIDIETASICDLACPHCYREYIVTPDKIMKKELYEKIIKEISEMEVPSIKLNWRGEPLLNPSIDKFIYLAKKKGILDVSINTNATTLDEKKSIKILESGLDQIIFSFDGGSKKTYEKMRPGRFKNNKFDDVYKNIKNFCELKKKLGKVFPITKIQMVMTKSSRPEAKSFFQLFADIIDIVVLTQYQERGGKVDDILPEQKSKLEKYCKVQNLSKIDHYIAKADGDLLVSKGRKICDQIYQRLMVTYDGRVGMCCHDWGAKHCIGYLNDDGYQKYESDLKKVFQDTQSNKKGFELLKNIKMPEKYNEPELKISNLKDIWYGDELKKVRDCHNQGKQNSLSVCKNCTYKDSYYWEKI